MAVVFFFFSLPKDQRPTPASPFLTPWTRGCGCLWWQHKWRTGSWFPMQTFMNFCIISSIRLVCDFSSKSSGLTTAWARTAQEQRNARGQRTNSVWAQALNSRPFRTSAHERAFGSCPHSQALSWYLLPCGSINSLPNLWDHIVEARHISSGKKKSRKLSSCLTEQRLLSQQTLGSLGYSPSGSDRWGFSPWPCCCPSCVSQIPAPVPRLGHPWRLRGRESSRQCRRRWFSPWVGKIHWRRKWQPNLLFLPGKPHGQRSLAGLRRGGHDLATRSQKQQCQNGPIHSGFFFCVCVCVAHGMWDLNSSTRDWSQTLNSENVGS